MELSSADFCKLTVQEAADLLADKLEPGKKASGVVFYGMVDEQLCRIEMKLSEVNDDESVEVD